MYGLIKMENCLLQNQVTLQHLSKSYQPRDHVMPHRLVMVSMVHCDYTGPINDMDHCIIVNIFNDHTTGIICKEEYYERAVNDIVAYCKENQIYPVSRYDELQNVYIKRSNGTVENNWTVRETMYEFESGIFYAIVHHYPLALGKKVIFSELCQLNNFDQNSLLIKFDQLLDEWKKEMLNKSLAMLLASSP